ncbi:unnamed protein product [Vitrella brassicaformis CCMP3155]|uniref:Polysaccharide biosynthesis protein C-terminal domain-containing protein n=1 Tax=Vitrella brassicaformis (strain CCMP3155) TaxID=1169540 RepID=A0A0G4EWE7_VITBC|nr:unnamed protein product [Vitrella brassicaformis CCMP3155]|eukprot:CEM03282.1 unnamed protein product [Vitrella brassicaformis CCMP3155]
MDGPGIRILHSAASVLLHLVLCSGAKDAPTSAAFVIQAAPLIRPAAARPKTGLYAEANGPGVAIAEAQADPVGSDSEGDAATMPSLVESTTKVPVSIEQDHDGGAEDNSSVSHLQKTIRDLSVPALLGNLVDPALSTIDNIYVGRGLGATSLAALGPCISIFHVSFGIFRALMQSTTSLVARALGARDNDRAGELVVQSSFLAVGMGVIIAAALQLLCGPILGCMGVGAVGVDPLALDARAYLKARAWAAPSVVFTQVAEGAFRGFGDTKTPLFASLLAAVVNLILDPIMIFSCQWGTAGAAAATAVAQYAAALTYAVLFYRRRESMRLKVPSLQGLSSAVTTLRRYLSASSAMLVRSFSLLVCWATITASATKMGVVHVAAHNAILQLFLIFAMGGEAIAVSTQVLIGRYSGAKQPKQIGQVLKQCLKIAAACSCLLSGLLFALRPSIPSWFGSDAAVRGRLLSLIPVVALLEPLTWLVLVFEGSLVGMGRFKWLGGSMLLATLASAGIIRHIARLPGAGIRLLWIGGVWSLFLQRLVYAGIGLYRSHRQRQTQAAHLSNNKLKTV